MRSDTRAWAEISLDAIENNIKEIRRHVEPGAKIMGVVKADAYGHGYLETARTLLENGADSLAVAFIDEAIQLRRCGIECPLLILGHSSEKNVKKLVENDIMPNCYSVELAEAMSAEAVRQGKTGKIHIKIDTGMSRVGFRYTEDEEINAKTVEKIVQISKLPNIVIAGIFTHFAVADSDDDEYTNLQFRRFMSVCEALEAAGVEYGLRHCCNSAALMRFKHMHLDMVRPGIILYGEAPSEFVPKDILNLKPAMTLKARVTNLKELEPGVTVSYGRKYKTERATKVATIPIGYADGYSRILSGKAKVMIGGVKCDVIGTICMDQCMADVTNVNNINVGDEIILFGGSESGPDTVTVCDLAEMMGTINYEILCVIGKRIPRVFVRGGKIEDVHNYLLDSPVSETS